MLRCIGPLQIGHFCSVAANSSLTHALHSTFLHFQIFVGFRFSFVSVLVAKNNDPFIYPISIGLLFLFYIVNDLCVKVYRNYTHRFSCFCFMARSLQCPLLSIYTERNDVIGIAIGCKKILAIRR